MHRLRIYLIAILLLAFGVAVNGQEQTKAVLFDEFEMKTCSELRGRIDHFLQAIADNMGEKGVVITRSSSEKKVNSIIREEKVKAQIEARRFDRSRIIYVRVHGNDQKTEFWRLPISARLSESDGQDATYTLPGVKKPFLLLYDDEYDEGECYDRNEPRILSHFLKENEGSLLNIVFYTQSAKEVNTKKRRILNSLVKTHQIKRNRIRIFLKIIRHDPENPKPTEYWYLPPKKR